ncbi:hypothetical protein PPERSA_02377 [Pseudocohnilembus persalinus]|uniref:Oxysterol-binding protein n=1 Tax=Pseudocohnilembus persalinus TaxID=266149 RepID=A0A0V0QVE3_PSEPJ|nr:hypothetical protein PPERSA_02377 [Pseudocohnilembus persalinus]|eukprot:KRX05845.1 hypothetical protein PPERSA_02377 [Pseudocohnilembus persalinus]
MQYYEINKLDSKYQLFIKWKNQEETNKIINLDVIYECIKKLENQNDNNFQVNEKIQALKNYVQSLQDDQLIEHKFEQYFADCENQEKYLKIIVNDLFEILKLKGEKYIQEFLRNEHSEKIKNYYDHLSKILEQNSNKSEDQLIEIENNIRQTIQNPSEKIIIEELNEILKIETKILTEKQQFKNQNHHDQKALNIYEYLQNNKISEQQSKIIENLITEKNQHILNCIQNYHIQDIGIKQKEEQKTIYPINNQDKQDNIDENQQINNSNVKNNDKKNDKKNKKQHRILWFNKDYKSIQTEKGGNNGLHYINKEFLKVQSKVYGIMVKKFGKVIFTGKPIYSITIPTCMFQAESMLERTAYTFGHNYYLNYAACTDDISESIKFATCFFQSSFLLGLTQQLPLNPILGETFQGRINGDPIYFEQISHHPPISYYLMIGQNYKLHSPHQPAASIHFSYVEGTRTGNPVIELQNGKKIYYIWFPIRIKGLVFGERVIKIVGRSFCFEPESRTICQLNYDQNVSKQQFYSNIQNKYDVISGGIYQVTQKCIEKFIKAHKFPSTYNPNLKVHLETEVEKIISKAEGDYKEFLSYDGVKYWNANVQRPFIIQMENHPLPSDSRYRMDSIALRQGDSKKADKNKDYLENLQRNDKKLRIKYSKKK